MCLCVCEEIDTKYIYIYICIQLYTHIFSSFYRLRQPQHLSLKSGSSFWSHQHQAQTKQVPTPTVKAELVSANLAKFSFDKLHSADTVAGLTLAVPDPSPSQKIHVVAVPCHIPSIKQKL